MAQSMFLRYGGFASVSKVVSAFYEKAIESPLLSPYFEKIDMARLIDHQTKFISTLMGGPASFSNEELERVHSNLNINEQEFLPIRLTPMPTRSSVGHGCPCP